MAFLDTTNTLPPRPEEDLAHAEDYRVMLTALSSFYEVKTPYGTEYLLCDHGDVQGFSYWKTPISFAEENELTREVLSLCPSCSQEL